VVMNDIHGMASLLKFLIGGHLVYKLVVVYNGILVVMCGIHGMASLLKFVDGGHRI